MRGGHVSALLSVGVAAMMQCQVLLWLDSKTVAPRKPILFDMANPQHKRYEVSLGIPGMPDIIVSSEKQGDSTVIDVRSKEGTGLAKRLPFPSGESPRETPTADLVSTDAP